MKEPVTNKEKIQAMLAARKVVNPSFLSFLVCSSATILLILGLWGFFICVSFLGCPFPPISINKFFDLGFFSFSTFSFIIFLTMIPLQTSEGRLSPGFYLRMLQNPRSHFGLYVLMVSAISCFVVLAFESDERKEQFNLLFMALTGSIIFAILFHRASVLRSIYQPYTVYKSIEKLSQDETREEVWLELLECTYKAIAGRHINYATNFLQLLFFIYQRNQETPQRFFSEDLRCLYKNTSDIRPIGRYMEAKWPFLLIPQTPVS